MSHRHLTTSGQSADEIRVAFTGHRRNKLDPESLKAVSVALRLVFEQIHQFAESHLCLVTSLADGSDLTAAAVANELEIPIDLVIPFSIEAFRSDFTEDADQHEYDRALQLARTITTIGGIQSSSEERNSAYVRVAECLTDGASLLVAVWDGEPAEGPGGTAEVVALARSHRIPVVWVHAVDPEIVSVLSDESLPEGATLKYLLESTLMSEVRRAGQLP